MITTVVYKFSSVLLTSARWVLKIKPISVFYQLFLWLAVCPVTAITIYCRLTRLPWRIFSVDLKICGVNIEYDFRFSSRITLQLTFSQMSIISKTRLTNFRLLTPITELVCDYFSLSGWRFWCSFHAWMSSIVHLRVVLVEVRGAPRNFLFIPK